MGQPDHSAALVDHVLHEPVDRHERLPRPCGRDEQPAEGPRALRFVQVGEDSAPLRQEVLPRAGGELSALAKLCFIEAIKRSAFKFSPYVLRLDPGRVCVSAQRPPWMLPRSQ